MFILLSAPLFTGPGACASSPPTHHLPTRCTTSACKPATRRKHTQNTFAFCLLLVSEWLSRLTQEVTRWLSVWKTQARHRLPSPCATVRVQSFQGAVKGARELISGPRLLSTWRPMQKNRQVHGMPMEITLLSFMVYEDAYSYGLNYLLCWIEESKWETWLCSLAIKKKLIFKCIWVVPIRSRN